MKNFRQLVFFYLITLAGLLWAVFLLMDTEWLFPATCNGRPYYRHQYYRPYPLV